MRGHNSFHVGYRGGQALHRRDIRLGLGNRQGIGRGGSCVGSCYLTDTNVSARVLRHEHVHREQWRHYCLAMPFLYFVAGRDPLKNRFEIEAGLEDGGYVRRR